jgi:DNA-binding NtrC family response regulator
MSSAQPLSVLVADPDVETRGALSAFLCEEGFAPTELEDPAKAPGAIKEGRFQMVLSISARRMPMGSSSSRGSARWTTISA